MSQDSPTVIFVSSTSEVPIDVYSSISSIHIYTSASEEAQAFARVLGAYIHSK